MMDFHDAHYPNSLNLFELFFYLHSVIHACHRALHAPMLLVPLPAHHALTVSQLDCSATAAVTMISTLISGAAIRASPQARAGA